MRDEEIRFSQREEGWSPFFFFFHEAPEGQEEALIRGGRIQQKKMVLIP